jgi:hypothetical protein
MRFSLLTFVSATFTVLCVQCAPAQPSDNIGAVSPIALLQKRANNPAELGGEAGQLEETVEQAHEDLRKAIETAQQLSDTADPQTTPAEEITENYHSGGGQSLDQSSKPWKVFEERVPRWSFIA